MAGSPTPGEVRGHDLTFSHDGRPTGRGDGSAHYGRIFKVPHPLQFVSDEGHRRLIGARLNVTEARHRLTRRIFFRQRGELRQHFHEGTKTPMTLITTPFPARATAAEVLAGVDLTGRRMIVTGGASGLGTETVRALAGAGAHVTIATRNPALAKPILEEFPRTEVAALDLADLESVRAFCAEWDGPVDALIANAGVMMLPERQVSAQGWEMQLATNYLGHFALVTGLRAALQSAERARVVTVSSGAQLLAGFDFDDPQFERRPYDPLAAYAQSKAADVLLAVGISRRWAEDGIHANACAPGTIHTNLGRHLDPAVLQMLGALDADGNKVTPAFYKTPEQGAATTTLLAASPLLEGVTGRYFEDNQEAELVEDGPALMAAGGPAAMVGVARWSIDPAAADRLWEYALTATRHTV